MAQPLVLHNGTLVNGRQALINRIKQGSAIGARFNTTVWVFVDLDLFANDTPACRRVGQQVKRLVVLQCQAMGDTSRFAYRKDQIQILVRSKRPVCIKVIARRLAKSLVEIRNECGGISIEPLGSTAQGASVPVR
jgi:hypothetical protein